MFCSSFSSSFALRICEDNQVLLWSTFNHQGEELDGLGVKYLRIESDGVEIVAFGLTFYAVLLNGQVSIHSWDEDLSLCSHFAPNRRLTEISCGNDHIACLDDNHHVYTCGYNGFGQLGNRTGTTRTFSLIDSLEAQQVACGYDTTYVIDLHGSVWFCGSNDMSALGCNHPSVLCEFTKLHLTQRIIRVGGGKGFTVLLDAENYVWVCGTIAETRKRSFERFTDEQFNSIAVGGSHFLALTDDKRVFAMGKNSSSQLGDKQYTSKKSLTCIFQNAVAIGATRSSSLFVDENGLFWMTGCSLPAGDCLLTQYKGFPPNYLAVKIPHRKIKSACS